MTIRASHHRCWNASLVLALAVGAAEWCGDDETTAPFGGWPPSVTFINFPDTIPGAPGDRTRATVGFSDRDGDIVRCYVEVVSADLPFDPFNWDPGVSGRTQGTFGLNIGCAPGGGGCSGSSVTLRVILRDDKDNRSYPVNFSFTYQ
jgi:hypothetical protein